MVILMAKTNRDLVKVSFQRVAKNEYIVSETF